MYQRFVVNILFSTRNFTSVKEFLEAGKKRLAGDVRLGAISDEAAEL